MKYIDLFFKYLGLFIISVPLAYLYLAITEDMPINASKGDWIRLIIFCFIGTVVLLLIEIKKIRKKNKADSNVIKDEDTNVKNDDFYF